MTARRIPVSYLLFSDEGHGLHRKPNRLAFWAATEAFLAKHLGGAYQPATAAEFQGTTLQVPVGPAGIPGFSSLLKELQH